MVETPLSKSGMYAILHTKFHIHFSMLPVREGCGRATQK